MREIRWIGIGLLLITIPSQCVEGATLTSVTSCSVDGLPTPCGDASLDPPAGTAVFYNDGLGGTFLKVSVVALTNVNIAGNTSASAAIDLMFYATTAGPVRPGVARLSIFTDGDGSFGSLKSAGATASVNGLPDCAGIGPPCSAFQDFPFTLGLPFQIKLSSSVAVEAFDEIPEGFSTDAGIELSLFELVDGTLVPVNILGPVAVPEPNQFVPALLFAGAGFLWKLRARKAPGKL